MYEPGYDKETLDMAESFLKEYSREIGELFGIQDYDYTIHAHKHLRKQVEDHGSFYYSSMFSFEGFMGQIVSLASGTRGYLNQTLEKLKLNDIMIQEIQKQKERNKLLNRFVNSFLKEQNRSYKFEFENLELLGPFTFLKLEENLVQKLRNFENIDSAPTIQAFSRISINKRVFHSLSYNQKGESNSYLINYSLNNKNYFADIQYFFKFKSKVYAVVQNYKINKEGLRNMMPESTFELLEKSVMLFDRLNRFYLQLEGKEASLKLIEVQIIQKKCVKITYGELEFLTKLEYDFEHD
jgi:hypothetical protein